MRHWTFTLAFIIGLLMFATPSEAQTLRNGSGSTVGKVESNGTVRDGNGSRIGKVESDGTVRNGNGSNIGKAEGVNRRQAAACFFFFFN